MAYGTARTTVWNQIIYVAQRLKSQELLPEFENPLNSKGYQIPVNNS